MNNKKNIEDLINYESNKIIFHKRQFNSIAELYLKVAQQLQILVESGYICTLYDGDDGKGLVVLEYNLADNSLGTPIPVWLLPDEIAYVERYQQQKYIAELREELESLDNEDDGEPHYDA